MNIVDKIVNFIIDSEVTNLLKTNDIKEIAECIFGEEITNYQIVKIKKELKNRDFPYLKDSKLKDEVYNEEKEEYHQNILNSFTLDKNNLYYDALLKFEDFIKDFDITKGGLNLPRDPILVLTYIASEFDDEGCTFKDRLELDKNKLETVYDVKVMNSDEQDKLYLVVGTQNTILRDSVLSKRQKIYYAEKLEGIIEPKLLKRNYRLDKTKKKGRR